MRLVSEYKYGCEKVHTVIRLYGASITDERKLDGEIQKREIYFGRAFDSFDINEYDVLGTMIWDESKKELTVSPLIITNIVFSQYSNFSGKRRELI